MKAIYAAMFLLTAAAGSQPLTAQTTTAQMNANIDQACQGALGTACSTNSQLYSVYTDITSRIRSGKLAGDSSSILYNYLIPMLQSSPGWQANVVDTAWVAIGCGQMKNGQITPSAPESQWMQKFGTSGWQTYQQLSNQMRSSGCPGAAANVATAPVATQAQAIPVSQVGAAYTRVWGAAYNLAPATKTCNIAGTINPNDIMSDSENCARSALAAYVKAHGNSILQTLAAPVYQQAVGQPLDSAHAQVLFYQFGNYWAGADDLANYLKQTAAQWKTLQVQSSTTLAGLDSRGCLVLKNAAGQQLPSSGSCGSFMLTKSGAQAAAAYAVNVAGTSLTTSATSNPAGLLVGPGGQPAHIIINGGSNWQVLAGASVLAQGSGKLIGQDGSGLIGQDGSGLLSLIGTNIIAAGGGNFRAMAPSAAASAVGLISNNNAQVISNDGGSFTSAISSIIVHGGDLLKPNPATFVGNNSSTLTQGGATSNAGNGSSLISPGNVTGSTLISPGNQTGSSVIGFNSAGAKPATSNLITDNGAGLKSNSYSLASVGANPVLQITGPATWSAGKSMTVTWRVQSAGQACTKGVQVMLNGSPGTATGALTGGSATQAGVSWPRGTRVSLTLKDLCNNAIVSAPYTTTIQ